MALNTGALISGIESAFAAAAGMEEGAGEARAVLASMIGNAIDDYVRGADVNANINVRVTDPELGFLYGKTTATGSLS
ncbi:MAG TPA: hypothetical protein PK327_07995 [Niabella sp.]|nr:hypothetical protein [Niabella sp.]HRB90373.1 hypothetical protein [Niabella sp.]HRB94941.1 hypothetical protein [Niabella sp.]HRC10762.1 hypothetical protein [Niabella sp.]